MYTTNVHLLFNVRVIGGKKKRDISPWTTIVKDLVPGDLSYNGPILDGIQIETTKDYQFQLLSYEGDITTNTDEKYIQTLPGLNIILNILYYDLS